MQPLGPGFRFVGRQAEVRPSGSDRLLFRVADSFENDGDRPLRSLEVRLPGPPAFDPQNLRVTINGKDVSLDRVSTRDSDFATVAFDPIWKQQQSREVVTEWGLIQKPAGRGTSGVSAAAFYVVDATALPLWQAPRGVFARGGPTPKEESLTVLAPPEFRVLAPGKQTGHGTAGGLGLYRFRIRPKMDFLPFVVAGRYQEQMIRTSHVAVIFWTFGPLDSSQAQPAAARLASSFRAFTDFFGPASGSNAPVYIVEAPGELADPYGGTGDPGGVSFPGGALLDSRAFARGVASEATVELAEYELARTWFGWRTRPSPEAQILVGRGLGLFALIVAAEARSRDDRQRMVRSLLARYDQSRRTAADRRLLEPAAEYSLAERISTGYRAALLFVALEDLCGRENLRRALRQVVRARGGDTVAYEDLRAAVEAASRRDLSEMFRSWLNQPGVPDDFRAHYAVPAAQAQD